MFQSLYSYKNRKNCNFKMIKMINLSFCIISFIISYRLYHFTWHVSYRFYWGWIKQYLFIVQNDHFLTSAGVWFSASKFTHRTLLWVFGICWFLDNNAKVILFNNFCLVRVGFFSLYFSSTSCLFLPLFLLSFQKLFNLSLSSSSALG